MSIGIHNNVLIQAYVMLTRHVASATTCPGPEGRYPPSRTRPKPRV